MKSIILLIFFNFGIGNFFSQEGWIANKKNSCKFYTFSNANKRSIIWEGECLNGFVNGNGILKIIQNDTLVVEIYGTFLNGYTEGNGTLITRDGQKYEGNFKQGKFDGQGVYTFNTGEEYTGDFKQGKYDGYGIFKFLDGTKSIGEWKDGKKVDPKVPLDGEIAIVVTGTGRDFESSRKNALRSAIEQTFGVFVSSNTSILNDELIKDEISTISSGNILSFDILNESSLPNGIFVSNLKAIVSIKNLQSYSTSKGATVEFSGGIFGIKIKMAQLNESSEIVAMKNLLLQSKEILKKSIDFTVKTGEPKIYLKTENPNDYDIELNVTCTLNDNIDIFNSFFKETLESIKMSEGEIADYKTIDKKKYSFTITQLDSQKKSAVRTIFYLRSEDSYLMLKNFFIKTNIFLRQFEIVTNMDSWDLENEYFKPIPFDSEDKIVDFCVGPSINKHLSSSGSFPEFYFYLPQTEYGYYTFNDAFWANKDIPIKDRRLIFQDSNFLLGIGKLIDKPKDLILANVLWLNIDQYANDYEDVEMRIAQSNGINYFVNKKGDQYFHKLHYIRELQFIEKINTFEVRPKI